VISEKKPQFRRDDTPDGSATLAAGLVHDGAGIIDAAREAAARDSFAADLISGLSARHKQLPPKYFYDATGSRLFREICSTDEYYVTRSETILLRNVAAEIATGIANGATLVEFGSGESAKTRLLLDAAPQLSTYVPIDISADALYEASDRLARDYPQLSVAPVVADFTGHFRLPIAADGLPRIGFFPGSTLGNFDRDGAVRFLRSVRQVLGIHAALLVGVDLIKDPSTLIAAYDDSRGVTARFNKNLLTRINRELGGDFDPDAFDHLALWNAVDNRVEIYLVSRKDQIVNAAGNTFAFRRGERLHTENSHKFTVAMFARLVAEAGWSANKTWISDAPQVALFCLEPALGENL
jgi:dimethylhistidine N-methyltransferase